MEPPHDPTLGELDRQGMIHPDLAELYTRILGDDWRGCRLGVAIEAIIDRSSEAEDRHTTTSRPDAA